jgi:hypothetical protein
MGTFKTLEEIEAWQQARELTRLVYEVSSKGAFGHVGCPRFDGH